MKENSLSDLYYLAFPRDKVVPTKILVYFIFIYEIVQTCLLMRDGFREFGTDWGNYNILNEVGWTWLTIPMMTGISASCLLLHLHTYATFYNS